MKFPFVVHRVDEPEEKLYRNGPGGEPAEEVRQRVVLHAITHFDDGPPDVFGTRSLSIILRGDKVNTYKEGEKVSVTLGDPQ